MSEYTISNLERAVADAVHRAGDAVEHAKRALEEVGVVRGRMLRVLPEMDEAESAFRLQLASLARRAQGDKLRSRPLTYDETAALDALLAHHNVVAALTSDDLSIASVLDIGDLAVSLATMKLLPKEPLKKLERACDTLVTHMQRDQHQECLGRLEEARLTLRNTLTGLSFQDEPRVLKPLPLKALVENAQASVQSLAASRRITFRLKGDYDSTSVAGDPELAAAVLSNLLNNAVKYSDQMVEPARAWVEISVRAAGEFTRLAIESWGVPILEDEAEAIFEQGIRGRHASRGSRMGTGTGLAQVRWACEAQGWEVRLVGSVPARAGETNPARSRFINTFELIMPEC